MGEVTKTTLDIDQEITYFPQANGLFTVGAKWLKDFLMDGGSIGRIFREGVLMLCENRKCNRISFGLLEEWKLQN